MFDFLHNKLRYVERDLNRQMQAPTFPIINITDPPKDAVEGQIAIGDDGSICWFLADQWNSVTGITSTVGNIPQDCVDGQIVIGSDNSLNWLVNGTWFGKQGIHLSGDYQDPIEGQIVLHG